MQYFPPNIYFLCREREIHNAFRNLDKDGNGFISAEELKQGMLKSLDKGIHKMMMNAA